MNIDFISTMHFVFQSGTAASLENVQLDDVDIFLIKIKVNRISFF